MIAFSYLCIRKRIRLNALCKATQCGLLEGRECVANRLGFMDGCVTNVSCREKSIRIESLHSLISLNPLENLQTYNSFLSPYYGDAIVRFLQHPTSIFRILLETSERTIYPKHTHDESIIIIITIIFDVSACIRALTTLSTPQTEE